MSEASSTKYKILSPMSGSFAEAVCAIRNEIGAKRIHMDDIVHAEFIEPDNCFPVPAPMPQVEMIVPTGIVSKAAQGFPTVEGRKQLTSDQVAPAVGHPAYAPVAAFIA